jgi:hypothetical protein
MKNFKYKLVIIVCSFFILTVNAFELIKGDLEQKSYPADLSDYKEYFLSNQLPEESFVYVKSNISDSSYYSLNRRLDIYDVTMTPKSEKSYYFNANIINSWALKTPSICSDSDLECIEPWWVGRWNDQEVIEPEIEKRLIDYSITLPYELSYGDEVPNAIGCLEHNPLRYGDFDDDSLSDLVIFLKNTLIVFSPQTGKVVFSSLFNYPDFVTWQTLVDAEMYLDAANSNTPQYASLYEFKKDRNAIVGYRAHAKLYLQDFNDNKSSDLVVWRKFYQSRLQGDNVKGFEKISDTYLHYSKINDEYQLQTDTAPETIQGWLTSKNLTWQSGFPSKSECAGQEGQLIPEMHDPLLNDPDVLK